MSPVFLGRVLFRRVLRVVNHDVGILHEFRMTPVAAVQNGFEFTRFRFRMPQAFPIRLVVAEVKQRSAVGFNPISKRGRRVVEQVGADPHAVNLFTPLVDVPIFNLRTELGKLNREVGIFHLPGKHVGKGTVGTLWSANSKPVARNEKGNEERKPLNVIPVGVAEQNGGGDGFRCVGHQVNTQGTRAGAGIKNVAPAGLGHHFHAGSVAPVSNRRRPRSCD